MSINMKGQQSELKQPFPVWQLFCLTSLTGSLHSFINLTSSLSIGCVKQHDKNTKGNPLSTKQCFLFYFRLSRDKELKNI